MHSVTQPNKPTNDRCLMLMLTNTNSIMITNKLQRQLHATCQLPPSSARNPPCGSCYVKRTLSILNISFRTGHNSIVSLSQTHMSDIQCVTYSNVNILSEDCRNLIIIAYIDQRGDSLSYKMYTAVRPYVYCLHHTICFKCINRFSIQL